MNEYVKNHDKTLQGYYNQANMIENERAFLLDEWEALTANEGYEADKTLSAYVDELQTFIDDYTSQLNSIRTKADDYIKNYDKVRQVEYSATFSGVDMNSGRYHSFDNLNRTNDQLINNVRQNSFNTSYDASLNNYTARMSSQDIVSRQSSSDSPMSGSKSSNDFTNHYKSMDLSSGQNHYQNNMSDYSNREQAFVQNNQSFNQVRDDYSEQAFTFSANDQIMVGADGNEYFQSEKLDKDFQRINRADGRLTQSLERIDQIDNEFGLNKTKVKVTEYIEDESGDLHKVNGSIAKKVTGRDVRKKASKLSDADKQNRNLYLNDRKRPKDRVKSHTYSEELYLGEDGKEFKRVKVTDTNFKYTKKKSKLLRKKDKMNGIENILERNRKRGRLLFYGGNAIKGMVEDNGGNESDRAQRKLTRKMTYAAKRVTSGLLIDANRGRFYRSKAGRYYLKSSKAELDARIAHQKLEWKRQKYDRDALKERYKRSAKTKADRKKLREEKRQLHKKQDSFFQRVSQKKAIKKKKKMLRQERMKAVASMIGSWAVGFLVVLMILVLVFMPLFVVIGSLVGGLGDFVIQVPYETLSMTNEYFTDMLVRFQMFVSPDFEDNYESILSEQYPDVYAFEYDLPDEFTYDTVLLKAYLGAKYKEFDITDPEVQADLDEIFELFATYEHEIVPEYRDVPIYEHGVMVGTEQQLVDICYITAELHDLEEILRARLSDSQNEQVDKYLISGLGQTVYGPVMAQSWGYSGAEFRVSSEFGYRVQPTEGASTYHKGIDIACPTGTPLYSAVAGTVELAGDSGKGGLRVRIRDSNTGVAVVFMHMSEIAVSVGQEIALGEYVGKSGNTGNTTGPHLHLAVMDENDVYHDPRDYIPSIIE